MPCKVQEPWRGYVASWTRDYGLAWTALGREGCVEPADMTPRGDANRAPSQPVPRLPSPSAPATAEIRVAEGDEPDRKGRDARCSPGAACPGSPMRTLIGRRRREELGVAAPHPPEAAVSPLGVRNRLCELSGAPPGAGGAGQ